MFKIFVYTMIGAAFLGPSLYSEDEGLEYKTTGYFMWDMGYLNQGQNESNKVYKKFIYGDVIGGAIFTANPSDNLSLKINPEIKSYHPFPREEGGKMFEQRAIWQVYMEEARADLKLGDPSNPMMTFGLGYMIQKDNPDAHMLGDYLFRSMIYPGVLFTKFNNATAQILGIKVGQEIGENFQHGLFLTTDFDYYPYFDFSLTYSAALKLGNVFEVGAGVSLRNVIPVKPSWTSPDRETGDFANVVYEIPVGQQTILANGDTLSVIALGADSTGKNITGLITQNADVNVLDTTRYIGNGLQGTLAGPAVNNGLADFVDSNYNIKAGVAGEKQALSFAGTLISARMAFNVMGLLGDENPLGRDALKVYIEGAVLGWKDYIVIYSDRRERTPIMGGMYLPTFDFLDFLVLEVEHYPNPHYPGYQDRGDTKVPTPGSKHANSTVWLTPNQVEAAKMSPDWIGNEDDWKWGLAMKKSFKGVGVVAQVGTDHMKLLDKSNQNFNDIMMRPDEWYFQLRLIAGL